MHEITTTSPLGKLTGGRHLLSCLLAERIRQEAVSALNVTLREDRQYALAVYVVCQDHPEVEWWLAHKRPFTRNARDYWASTLDQEIQARRVSCPMQGGFNGS